MELRLDGKVALITGGSKGIGKAIATAYAEAGAHVLISSRKSDALEVAASEIRSVTGAEVQVYAANAGDPDAAAACVAHTVETLGGLDILVNNAATNPYMGQMIDIDLPRLDKTYDVNFRGVFGVNIGGLASTHGCQGRERNEHLVHRRVERRDHHRPLQRDQGRPVTPDPFACEGSGAPEEVRMNAICPGLVKTDMARALWESNEDAVAQMVPLQRLGEPEDIANAALFLGLTRRVG